MKLPLPRESLTMAVAVRVCLLGLAFAAAACGESPRPAAAPGEWLAFEGSWNATGSRHTISLGADRLGSIVALERGDQVYSKLQGEGTAALWTVQLASGR